MNDLIYRNDAIDAHCELCRNKGKCNCDICADVEVFSLLPSAQPEPRWIPVTEKLPEERIAVLVYEKNYRNSYTAYYESAHGGWMKFGANIAERFGEHLNIVAWMPLPDPWKGEEE